jgi:dephospho-CoA kinase
MLNLKKIAVTGSLSCGKSLVCKFLGEFGAYVVDADHIVHQLLTPNTEVGDKVVDLLGSDIFFNGQIDRSRVAAKVFHHPTLLRKLESLLHPRVYVEIQQQYEEIKRRDKGASLFVAEIPLLFETEGEKYFDSTIAVVADPEICWLRYRKSTGYEKEEFNRRMARQLKPEEKAKRANYIIRNNGTETELKIQVQALYDELMPK